MRKDFISVIIPAYNEEPRISETLKKIHQYLRENFEDFEIIVVDDGSTDSTAALVSAIRNELSGIKLRQNGKNMGKGFSVKNGILSSKGNLVLMSDADLSTPIEELQKLLPFIDRGFDIATGSRGLKESDIVIRQPWYRERMGKTFNVFVRLLLIGGIKDTQCGFKLFKGDVARRVFGKTRIHGFSFDVEVLFIAKKMGYKIKEIPIRWLNSPDSKVRVFKDSAKMLLELLKIKAYGLTGRYG